MLNFKENVGWGERAGPRPSSRNGSGLCYGPAGREHPKSLLVNRRSILKIGTHSSLEVDVREAKSGTYYD